MNKQEIMKQYPTGTKIKLINMQGEPQMKSGLLGTVKFVDDMCQIHVSWQNGSSLAIAPSVDTFEIVK